MTQTFVNNSKAWIYALGNLLLTVLIAFVAAAVVSRIVHFIFRKRYPDRKAINMRYLENMLRAGLILLALFWAISSSEATASLGKMLFQSTALIGAVAGFAAQPVISDLFCGLMISTQKPFELGDRIELDDGTSGIVKDITIRHVVLREMDTEEIIIPNSRLNAMKIVNMSRGAVPRSFKLTVNVSYDSDVKEAMAAVEEAVRGSGYTVPGLNKNDVVQYAPVYFLSYAESSLVLKTIVYYQPSTPTEVFKNDVNLRVNALFNEKGIEIPYNYVNVVMKNGEETHQ